MVVRTQVEPSVTETILQSVKADTSSTSIVKPIQSVVDKKTDSAWGDFSFEEDECTMDDLTALLNIRDMKISETNQQPTISKQVAPPLPPSIVQCQTTSHINCWDITEMEESWTTEDEVAALEGVVVDTGDSSSSEHIDRLLKSYYEGEEDLEIVNLVKKQQLSSNKSNESSMKVEEHLSDVATTTTGTTVSNKDLIKTSTEKAINSKNNNTKKSKSTTSNYNKTRSNTTKGKEGDGGESSEDEEVKEAGLARSSQRQRCEAYFLHRVSYYPAQVLRYAYGGTPLWITHPSPLSLVSRKNIVDTNSSSCSRGTTAAGGKGPERHSDTSAIPPCEWCGKARVFECQLMPGLLSIINTTTTSTSTNVAAREQEKVGSKSLHSTININDPLTKPSAEDLLRFQQSLGDDLDFGVVAIYVCPDSCNSSSRKKDSSRYATEVAIVQAPSDII